jgi:hypothetical protein
MNLPEGVVVALMQSRHREEDSRSILQYPKDKKLNIHR